MVTPFLAMVQNLFLYEQVSSAVDFVALVHNRKNYSNTAIRTSCTLSIVFISVGFADGELWTVEDMMSRVLWLGNLTKKLGRVQEMWR